MTCICLCNPPPPPPPPTLAAVGIPYDGTLTVAWVLVSSPGVRGEEQQGAQVQVAASNGTLLWDSGLQAVTAPSVAVNVCDH